MENKENKQDCGCSDGCCTPSKKNNMMRNIIFGIIILAAVVLVVIKFTCNNCNSNAGAGNKAQTCDTLANPGCCAKK